MKSQNNNNQPNQLRTTTTELKTPLSKRRLKTKPALMVMAILLLGNILWFILWIFSMSSGGNGGDEIVATVDGETITRQQWMAAMEDRYGKETLHSMVNDTVMEKAAAEYDITVTDGEVDLEIALISSTQDLDTSLTLYDQQQTRQKVRAQLILEKVLTKDIIIEETAIESVYEENKSLYNIPNTYRTSMIIVSTLDEAKHVQNELRNGSDFSLLARERSIDTFSASLGGNIGYISSSQTNIDPAIQDVVASLDEGEMSEPFVLGNGNYGILFVSEIIQGRSFTFEEAKEHIKTEMAMKQLPSNVSSEMFWEEFKVSTYFLK